MPSLFRRQRPSSAPDIVYPSSLATLYQGYALWYPEPHVTGEAQIGDVGYIREGAFIRLFNLNSSRPEHQVTFWGGTFEPSAPLPPGVFDRLDKRRSLPADHYRSHGVERLNISGKLDVPVGPDASIGANASYICKESQGAVLILNSPAHRESVFENDLLWKYMLRHHREWCEYARITLGQRVKSSDVVLLAGCVKTSADWKVVAFTRSSIGYHTGLEGHAFGAGAELRGSRTRELEPPKMHREGLLYPRAQSHSANSDPNASPDSSGSGEPLNDQSAFLNRYRTKRRGLFKKIVAGAGPHQLPEQEGGRSARNGEGLVAAQKEESVDEDDLASFENEGTAIDPLDTLLDYMLEVSDAETAIASDDDLLGIVGGDVPVDLATYLRHAQLSVNVADNCATISIRDTIARQRSQAVARRSIAPSDVGQWPGLSSDGAATLEDGKVHIGPAEDDALPIACSHVVFREPFKTGHDCRCFAMSTDGRLLAIAFDRSHIVWVWRLSDGLLVQRLQDQGHTESINSLAFSPTGQTIVSGSSDRSAIIWNIRNGHATRRLGDHATNVRSATFSPDGLLVATGCKDGAVKIWDSGSGKILHSFNLGSRVWRLRFSPDSLRLVIKLVDMGAIYDVPTGTLIATLQHGGGERLRLSLSSQGDRIITSTREGKAKIWNAVTGEQLLELTEHTTAFNSHVAFSPDGAEVAIALSNHTVMTCDSRTGQQRQIYRVSSPVWRITYSPDGGYVAVGSGDGPVRVWNARSGAFLAEFKGHRKGIDTIQFLSDGHSLLSLSLYEKDARLWSIRDAIRLR